MGALYYYASVITAILSFVYYVIVHFQSPSKEQKVLQLIATCNMVFSICNATIVLADDSAVCEAALYISFIGASNIGLCFLCLLGFISHIELPTWFKMSCLAVNTLFTALALTNGSHHLMYKQVSYEIPVDGPPVRHLEFGELFWVYLWWVAGSLFVSILVIAYCAIKKPKVFKGMRTSIITFGIAGTMALGTFFLCDFLKTKYDFSAVGCCIGAILMLVIIIFFRTYPMQQNSEEAMLNSMDDILLATDNQNRFVYANAKAVSLLDPNRSFTYGMDVYGVDDNLDRFMNIQKEEEVCYDGRYYVCEILEFYRKGHAEGFIHWLRDITKEHEFILESKRLQDAAEVANKAKGEFLAHMSHEIRTPINAILGMNEMISRESSDAAILDYSETIKRNGDTLLALINDILDFSKIEAGKLDINISTYEVPIMLRDLLLTARKRAEGKPIEVKARVDAEVPRQLMGDEVRVRQIVTNLLTNAVKYTEKGQIELAVSYKLVNNSFGELSFKVSDTGIGIKQEDIGRLFERFERLENNGNYFTEGTGLGMSITQGLLRQMNGRIDVESVYGEGSVFTAVVPQLYVDDETIGVFSETVPKEEEAEKKPRKKRTCFFRAENTNVLVVDDNSVNRTVAISLLKTSGISFDQAESGEQCLNMVKTKHYDIILMDYRMPVMNGTEALNLLRENKDHMCVGTPVIVMTADAGKESKDFFSEAGFDDYLVKPMDPNAYEKLIYDYIPENKKQLV